MVCEIMLKMGKEMIAAWVCAIKQDELTISDCATPQLTFASLRLRPDMTSGNNAESGREHNRIGSGESPNMHFSHAAVLPSRICLGGIASERASRRLVTTDDVMQSVTSRVFEAF